MSEEFPHGSVVWAKIPSFPWWPAKVIKPEPAHLSQLHLNKLRRTQYVVVFYNDNEQIGLCADFNLSPFENRALHHRAQREKGGLKARLLKAIEFAEDDLKLLKGRAPAEELRTKTLTSHDEDFLPSPITKRSHGSKIKTQEGKAEKRKRADSPVISRKTSTSLRKRKSSHRKKVKSDPMEDFIVEEGENGEEFGAEISDAESEHEVVPESDGSGRRRHKRVKYEKHLLGESGSEKHHRKISRSHRDSKPVKLEKKLHKSRTEDITPSQRVDVHNKDIHPIKNRSKKPREASESVVALPSFRPPSLSEEAYKSMMRDTENVGELSKEARFKMLMEHLRAIRESNVKQWKEGLKSADETVIIRKEKDLLTAVVPALLSGRRLVRWVAKGKTQETDVEFNTLEKQAIERALAVQNVYFELRSEQLNVAGAKLRDVMKSLAGISRAASRCFRDVLILWNDIYVSGPLKECVLDGTEFEQGDFFLDDADSPLKVKEELRNDSMPPEQKGKLPDSDGSHAASDSLKSVTKRTKGEREVVEPGGETECHRRESKKRRYDTSNYEEEKKRAKSRTSEESHRNSPSSSVKGKKLGKSHPMEAGKKKNRWKGFSKDKFVQVIKAQLSPLKRSADDTEHMEFIESLEKELAALFDPCTNGYYKTGLLMTHGIQRLVKSYKQSDLDEMNSDEENQGLKFLLDALKHPERASKLVDFIMK